MTATGLIDVAAFVDSDTQIEAVTPPGTGTVTVIVGTPGGASDFNTAQHFTYLAPTLDTVTPSSGPSVGGTPVVITGTGFLDAGGVRFGTTPATNMQIVSATEIHVVSPPGSGTVDVTVGGPAGFSATSAADQFTYVGAPAVTAMAPIAPDSGSPQEAPS